MFGKTKGWGLMCYTHCHCVLCVQMSDGVNGLTGVVLLSVSCQVSSSTFSVMSRIVAQDGLGGLFAGRRFGGIL